MQRASSILDGLMPQFMESIKADCLSKPFTPERSIIVDQIDAIAVLMQRDKLSFIESVRQLQG